MGLSKLLGEGGGNVLRILCECCGHTEPVEKMGECFRCGYCRCAIDRQGKRFSGPSKLNPSEIPKWGSRNK